jgi:hypothetical protein
MAGVLSVLGCAGLSGLWNDIALFRDPAAVVVFNATNCDLAKKKGRARGEPGATLSVTTAKPVRALTGEEAVSARIGPG